MTLPRLQKIALLIFLAALVFRLAFLPFSLFDNKPFSSASVSADGYREIAVNLEKGNGFSRSAALPVVPDSVRMPLYPLLIAGGNMLFGSDKAIILIQMLLGSLSAVMAMFIARKFLTPALSVAVGLLVALEPYSAYLSRALVTESTFTFVFLAALLLFMRFLERKQMSALASSMFLFGLATLIRPTTQYLPFALLIILWLNNERRYNTALLKQSIVSLFIFLAVLSPWILRQYTTFGTTMLNVQPVSTTYAYLVPSAMALEQGLSFEEASSAFYKEQGVSGIEDVNLWNYREFRTRAIEELRRHPIGLMKSVGVTVVTFFTNDAYAGMLSNLGVPISFAHPPLSTAITHPIEFLAFLAKLMQGPGALVVCGRIFWTFVTLLTVVGAILYLRARGATPEFLLCTGLIAYFALTTITIGLGVDGRFRIPVEPLIFIFALYGLQPLFRRKLPEKYEADRQSNFQTLIPR